MDKIYSAEKTNQKAVRSLLPVIMLMVMISTAAAVNITVEFGGPGIVGDMEQKIQLGVPFQVEIYMENTPSDPPRYGFSSPFRFYGTGDVETLLGPGTVTIDNDFQSIWNVFVEIAYESWDGDLTNGSPPGDQFCLSVIGMPPGWAPGSGLMRTLMVEFPGIPGGNEVFGDFCIDSGNFTNDAYDWLWDPPAPSFDPICLDVVSYVLPPYFTNCPLATLAVEMDQHIAYDLDAEYFEMDELQFELLSGPGEVDASTGLWTWIPTESDLGLHTVEVCVGIPYLPCPNGSTCEFQVYVYMCGDANADSDVNILDVTYIINYLYLGGPPPLGIESADVNGDGVVDIRDVTYLIQFLYMGGPPPDCP